MSTMVLTGPWGELVVEVGADVETFGGAVVCWPRSAVLNGKPIDADRTERLIAKWAREPKANGR